MHLMTRRGGILRALADSAGLRGGTVQRMVQWTVRRTCNAVPGGRAGGVRGGSGQARSDTAPAGGAALQRAWHAGAA